MPVRPIVPPELQHYYDDWRMSPGLEHDGVVYFTGFTGTRPDGTISLDAAQQFRDALGKVEMVLQAGGMDFGDLLEMTSYHVGLRDHIDAFRAVRAEYVREPYPAWTAIEVAGFVRPEAVVELRVIARKR